MDDFGGFSVRLWQECGEWAAELLDFPKNEGYISAGGVTPEEALQELRIAWDLVQEQYRSEDKQIPKPDSSLAA